MVLNWSLLRDASPLVSITWKFPTQLPGIAGIDMRNSSKPQRHPIYIFSNHGCARSLCMENTVFSERRSPTCGWLSERCSAMAMISGTPHRLLHSSCAIPLRYKYIHNPIWSLHWQPSGRKPARKQPPESTTDLAEGNDVGIPCGEMGGTKLCDDRTGSWAANHQPCTEYCMVQ